MICPTCLAENVSAHAAPGVGAMVMAAEMRRCDRGLDSSVMRRSKPWKTLSEPVTSRKTQWDSVGCASAHHSEKWCAEAHPTKVNETIGENRIIHRPSASRASASLYGSCST